MPCAARAIAPQKNDIPEGTIDEGEMDRVRHAGRHAGMGCANGAGGEEVVDRIDIVASVSEVVAAVSNSKLDQFAKSAILIQLFAIQRVANDASVFTDADLKLRIKAILADLVVSWGVISGKDAEVAERLKTWVWTTGIKVRAGLGLAADIGQIVSLLAGTTVDS